MEPISFPLLQTAGQAILNSLEQKWGALMGFHRKRITISPPRLHLLILKSNAHRQTPLFQEGCFSGSFSILFIGANLMMTSFVCPEERIGVLASGGLDSCVLVALLGLEYPGVQPIVIEAGLHWETAESSSLHAFLTALENPRILPPQVLSLPARDLYDKHWSLLGRDVPGYNSPDEEVYLPGRNLLLLSKAAVYCALHKMPFLAMGLLKGNPFPDAMPEFFASFEKTVECALSFPLKILTPFRELSKAEVLSRGKRFPLELTFSCLAPRSGLHCGQCNKCAERQRAFAQAGVADKTSYFHNP
jgi:7-cyano-7-deazaguanine synthase